MCHGGGTKTQLGEYDIVLGRTVGRRDGHRSLCEVRIDPGRSWQRCQEIATRGRTPGT
ncbi:hypothetical protein SHIRM173S_05545 [Streptomyces hirsutus]